MSKKSQKTKLSPKLSPEIQHLAEAIDKKGFKITFGLTPDMIGFIAGERIRLNEETEIFRKEVAKISIDDELLQSEPVDVIYAHYFWQMMAKELSWDALTLALYYFRHLAKQTKLAQASACASIKKEICPICSSNAFTIKNGRRTCPKCMYSWNKVSYENIHNVAFKAIIGDKKADKKTNKK